MMDQRPKETRVRDTLQVESNGQEPWPTSILCLCKVIMMSSLKTSPPPPWGNVVNADFNMSLLGDMTKSQCLPQTLS